MPLASGRAAGDAERRTGIVRSRSAVEPRRSSTQTSQQYVFPTVAALKNFPTDLHVEPTAVTTKAADGIDVPNQLFLPKEIEAW